MNRKVHDKEGLSGDETLPGYKMQGREAGARCSIERLVLLLDLRGGEI
jgi:hypothetical protein